ncbi:AAA family ATPase [Yunchengibacter salinarum]|uniref:AAA family ATPase n=1 Tax=Yunchengibacter salinarum TaxID=3133399 RepID=UPI0035B5B053
MPDDTSITQPGMTPPDATQPGRKPRTPAAVVAAYLHDGTTRDRLASALTARFWPTDWLRAGGVADAVEQMPRQGSFPHVLFVDISNSADPMLALADLADVIPDDVLVVAVGAANDATLYRELMRAGVLDYLVRAPDGTLPASLLDDALELADEALTRAASGTPASPAGENGLHVAVVGVRGGLGASSIAANTAWTLAEDGHHTALIDLDLSFGTAALSFDLEPGRGLADALGAPDRIDGLFLDRAAVKPTDKLSVLGCEAAPGSVGVMDPDTVTRVVDGLGEHFSHLVTDLPRDHLCLPGLAALFSDVVLVADQSLASVRDVIRLVAFLEDQAPDARLHLVLGRDGLSQPDVSEADFDASAPLPVSLAMPEDPAAHQAATEAGTVVAAAAPDSAAALACLDLADLLLGRVSAPDPAPQGGLMGRIKAAFGLDAADGGSA